MSKLVEVLFNDGTKKVYENAEAEREHEFLKIYHGELYGNRVRGEVRMENVWSWENIGQEEEGETMGEERTTGYDDNGLHWLNSEKEK